MEYVLCEHWGEIGSITSEKCLSYILKRVCCNEMERISSNCFTNHKCVYATQFPVNSNIATPVHKLQGQTTVVADATATVRCLLSF